MNGAGYSAISASPLPNTRNRTVGVASPRAVARRRGRPLASAACPGGTAATGVTWRSSPDRRVRFSVATTWIVPIGIAPPRPLARRAPDRARAAGSGAPDMASSATSRVRIPVYVNDEIHWLTQ